MKSRIVKGLITFWILAVSHCWQLTNAETSRLELTEAAHFVPVAQSQQLYSKSAPPSRSRIRAIPVVGTINSHRTGFRLSGSIGGCQQTA